MGTVAFRTTWLILLLFGIIGIVVTVWYTTIEDMEWRILKNSHSGPRPNQAYFERNPHMRIFSPISKYIAVGKEDDQIESPCKCANTKITDKLNSSAKLRRERELTEWNRQHRQSSDPLMMCEAFTPLRYPAGGVTVQPLKSTRLHGLRLHVAIADFLPEDQQLRIVLRCKNLKGVLVVFKHEGNSSVGVSGNDSTEMIITANKNGLHALNTVLANLNYKSTVYDINTRDIIYITMLNFDIAVHVHIKKPAVPTLYDPGPSGDINSLVTIITKTFERYGSVKTLISSIHKFYPKMTIIVADDSEVPEKINIPNVKHYIMPFAEGWFAGRNLALSQVRTKYFVWVDDDFVFTKGTHLENFLEKFKHPNLTIDVVGGTFGDANGKRRTNTDCLGCRTLEVTNNYENDDGDCLVLSNKKYHAVKEFPECFYADGTDNFFMARTSTTRSVGFDPVYNRMGHIEFHIDGLGKLRMMGSDVVAATESSTPQGSSNVSIECVMKLRLFVI
ncbi:beta-1,4 N-acetylgalactosaminyltransferase 1-like [Glandiceps talaboti]